MRGVLGRLRRGYVARTWPRWMNAAVEFRVSTCLGLMISARARSDRRVATLNPPILSCRGSAARSAVAHSKIVLQMPESLECCAVPFRQAGLGFIGCLEEIEENIVR